MFPDNLNLLSYFKIKLMYIIFKINVATPEIAETAHNY